MPWTITAKSETDAEILLYDVIGGYDDNWDYQGAKALIGKIKALGDVKNIRLRINSVGGDVFEAQAMYSYLKTHPAAVTVRIDGLAASAASLVAMAGDRIIMPRNALMMIHNPAMWACGEAEDMREAAEVLDKVRDTIAHAYMEKTGLDREHIVSMMQDETWMSAEEALALGFCDALDDPVEIAALATGGGTMLFRGPEGSARLGPRMASKLPKDFTQTVPMAFAARAIPFEGYKEDDDLKIENIADLERECPQLVAQVRNAAEGEGYEKGVQAERERLKALDNLNAPGRKAIIGKAKYEEPKDARDIAIELLQADRNVSALSNRSLDAAACNVALTPQATAGTQEQRQAMIDKIAGAINSMRGYAL